MNIVPIALQRIVDLISDSYVVVNRNGEIIDYNKPFVDTFQGVLRIKRKDRLVDILERIEHRTGKDNMVRVVKEALENKNFLVNSI